MNEVLIEQDDLYALPLYQKAKLKRWLHFAYLFILMPFIAFMFIPIDGLQKIGFNIVCLIFIIFFGYLWLSIAVTRRPYLLVTDEYLEYKWLFGHKIIEFSKIYQMKYITENGVLMLGIWDRKNRKLTFFEKTDRLFGRDCTVAIAVSTFSSIDFNRLQLTILSKINGSS